MIPEKILEFLINLIKTNPGAIVAILQMILDLIKQHPDLLVKLVESLAKKND